MWTFNSSQGSGVFLTAARAARIIDRVFFGLRGAWAPQPSRKVRDEPAYWRAVIQATGVSSKSVRIDRNGGTDGEKRSPFHAAQTFPPAEFSLEFPCTINPLYPRRLFPLGRNMFATIPLDSQASLQCNGSTYTKPLSG